MRKSLIILPLIAIGCSKPKSIKKINWEGSEEPPQIHASHVVNTYQLDQKNDVMAISQQSLSGVEIEESYIKNINYQKNGRQFVSAQYFEDVPLKLQKQISQLKEVSSSKWLDLLFKKEPQLKLRSMVNDPELKVNFIHDQLKPVIKFYFNLNNEEVESYVFDTDMNLIRIDKVSSHFSQTRALVYPEGPKLTPLMTVLLKTSLDTESAQPASLISIISESNQKINLNEPLIFNPPDEKFDQVQVYYYVSKSLNWFIEKLKIPQDYLNVKVITHLGYPEKTNAAFYFNGTIRLGSGDDVAFSQIPLDPSIVMHEAGHAAVAVLASLPYQNEGGSINEGYADFLTCFQLKNPRLGEVAYKKAAFKREISTLVTMKEKNGGLYHDSAIVSSVLWKLREKLGEERSLDIAVSTLKRLTPASTLSDFAVELQKVVESQLQGADLKISQELIKQWSE